MKNLGRTRRSLSLTPLLNPSEYVPVYANKITINGDDVEGPPKKVAVDIPEKREFIRNSSATSTRKFQRNTNNSTRRSLYSDSSSSVDSCEAIYSLYRPVSYSHMADVVAPASNSDPVVAAAKASATEKSTVTVRSSDLNYRSIKLKRKQLKPINNIDGTDAVYESYFQLHRSRTEDNISKIVILDDEPETNLKRQEMKSCEVLTNKFEDEDEQAENRIRILINNGVASSSSAKKSNESHNEGKK